ncbi:MAG TPA: NUDIX hydrolase [Rhodothermales bacterium]|nr:NUDIX hydrolase [Rhodothermales bacterium]
MKNLEEQTLDSEQLVDGKLLKVYRDRVTLPDGTTSHREWINHPGAAAVVALLDDDRILMVRQYRYPARDIFLEIPAGTLDGDEAPEKAVIRELKEETGYAAQRWTHLGALYNCIGYSNERIHIFLAQDLTPGEQQLDSGEFIEVEKVPFEEAVAQARRGDLQDMKTVAGLLWAEGHLSNK